MLDAIEAVLLVILPWSYVAKTVAVGVMWWTLYRYTIPTGPLGESLNDLFRKQMIQAAFNTWVMFILSHEIDAREIDWPFVSLALVVVTVWPWLLGKSYFQTWRIYWRMAREKEARR